MSLDQVKSILLSIATDPNYRLRFRTDREQALQKYRVSLTQEEVESLMAMPEEEEALAERVAEPVAQITFVGDIRS